jgi:hypothetical protein
MILGELKVKSETQQAFARMFTSLLHDLVTNAKKKIPKAQEVFTRSPQIYPKIGSRFKFFKENLETQEAYARMFTNLFHGLVVDAKLQKKILKRNKLLQKCSPFNSIAW